MSRACDLYVSNTFHARYRRVEYTLNIQSSKIKKANFTLENLFENFLCDIQSSKIKKANFTLENLFENFLCDKLQIKFLKYISKISKQSVNIAVLSEFGRYPLCIKAISNTCNFLQRLLTSNSELLQHAYKESSFIASRGKISWTACVEFVLKQIGVSVNLAYHKNFSSIVKTNLINRFKNNINTTLQKCIDIKEGKLRTYAIFKTHFQKEKYLSVIKDVEIRKCFMSFRISSHKLEIEKGRHRLKKLDVCRGPECPRTGMSAKN